MVHNEGNITKSCVFIGRQQQQQQQQSSFICKFPKRNTLETTTKHTLSFFILLLSHNLH